MEQWLQGFAYRVDISLLSFFLAGGLALLVAWLTISYQSVKAALANPVDSLRSE
jgi:putative ABC transport system permease protein